MFRAQNDDKALMISGLFMMMTSAIQILDQNQGSGHPPPA